LSASPTKEKRDVLTEAISWVARTMSIIPKLAKGAVLEGFVSIPNVIEEVDLMSRCKE